MLAVTLRHPWPLAFTAFGKDIENRHWSPNRLRVGDRIALHAGKAPAVGERLRAADADYWSEIREALAWMRRQGVDFGGPVTAEMIIRQSSAVFMVARYDGEAQTSGSRWFAGPIGWRLEDRVELATPVPCRGAQGLWQLPADVEAQVMAQLAIPDPTP